jgi:acetyltransferase-like isoleucine patch superfamily enzyme
VVIPSIRIGKWCTVGAGTVVIRDIPDYATAVGNPAKIIKMRKPPVFDQLRTTLTLTEKID